MILKPTYFQITLPVDLRWLKSIEISNNFCLILIISKWFLHPVGTQQVFIHKSTVDVRFALTRKIRSIMPSLSTVVAIHSHKQSWGLYLYVNSESYFLQISRPCESVKIFFVLYITSTIWLRILLVLTNFKLKTRIPPVLQVPLDH